MVLKITKALRKEEESEKKKKETFHRQKLT